ncbi:hypothetical protein KMW28_05380 [Flammeovirga yaeyamensis]|uniref:Outer membrane protein beta-barrel domain-containing protein n=1 Tax=Flammeovirga yaeyamensis TaxID=367791 RepID=A0AAX1N649_9BACT|nr:hypothetical protein [Flammeovirga yaeyamensis]MBB3697596.1 hypothetical protein [Flammeovirga yaeyamensis]NMF36286.1 hypothetical protein [Flammeovirga yaeyamensis]QWG03013.1 hypothetical protein KMW28_05380 [Flammeovirga yaeyamensis]
MKKINLISLLAGFMMLVQLPSYAQEHHEAEQHHEKKCRSKVSFYMGYTAIPQAINHDALIVPTIGFDYSYRLNKKFSIGIVNDLEMAQYVVEVEPATGGHHGGEAKEAEHLEREFAYVGAVVLYYSPIKGWNIGVGPGLELEKNKNFFVGKVVVEKEFELPGEWEIAPTLQYDIKEQVYDSWSLGVTFGKRF